MELADIWAKMAGNTLTPQELDFLKRSGRETQDRNSFLAGNISPDNTLKIAFPFSLVFYEKFEDAKASVTIQIPQDYSHLIIYGAGTISTANGGNIWAQFNGDTANNYQWQLISADNTTVAASHDLSDPYVALGVFGTSGSGTGVSGGFVSDIIHYKSPVWNKNVISRLYTAEFNTLYGADSQWNSLSPIQTIEIFGTDNTLAKGTADIAAGSIISVYGII
jgi:hypothetical protein